MIQSDTGLYTRLVKDMILAQEVRLVVNINDLRRKKPERCVALLKLSFDELLAFEKALKEFVQTIDSEYGKKHMEFFIGLEGAFGAKHVTPRTLSARLLGQIICVEGIVTKCSLVRSKVVKSVHYCPQTTKFMERKYSDFTNYSGVPTSSVYPTKDEEGNLLETEYGLSVYKDHQTFTIQEMPEKAPPGQLPRAVEIISDNDLVDVCKPGDRVQVIGVYRCLPAKQGSYTNGTFRTILLANNIRLLSKEVIPDISSEDVQKCKRFSRQKNEDVFEVLARSIAPTIHGHQMVKKAILCMLLGGVEKVLPSGTRLRGDVNVLLIGDPSVAKSQLLRYVLHSAPRAIPTTGRGSSGVGLTAAVVTDFETGDRRLEAGAMVLGDRGVVCIDEFDKMSDIDRTAIHEVMEQGTVTITKAGINARLNARCSVLAAANPVYGRYDEYKTPMENIGLQDSLLSRFDLIFIMLDKNDVENDTRIADHIVRVHRYRDPREQDGEPLAISCGADFLTTANLNESEEKSNTPIYEKYDPLLHANRSRTEKIVNIQFMKKYLHIAKTMKPKLTKEACDYIVEEYTNLRNFDLDQSDLARTQVVTVRALETMIRLATAHAKARLSRLVELEDAEISMELVHFAYFKKVVEKPKKRRKQAGGGSDGEQLDDEEMDVEDDTHVDEQVEIAKENSRAHRAVKRSATRDEFDFDNEEVEEAIEPEKKKRAVRRSSSPEMSPEMSSETAPESLTVVTDEQLKKFKSLLFKEFKKVHAQSLPLEEIHNSLEVSSFSKSEIDACLSKMQDANQVMVSDSVVFLI
jgi:DNA replication licensing factor MCM3